MHKSDYNYHGPFAILCLCIFVVLAVRNNSGLLCSVFLVWNNHLKLDSIFLFHLQGYCCTHLLESDTNTDIPSMLMIPCVASVSDRINARKLERFLHSIYLWWKAEQMLATRVPRILNSNLGPVVRMPVSAYPGLNFNLGFFFFLSKALSRIIFYILFRVSNHQIVGKDN